MIENNKACEIMAEESLRIVREKYGVNKINKILMTRLKLG